VNTEALVFRQINAVTFTEVKRQIRALFTSWWLSGWFDDVDGPAFEDQVSIKVDASNNPTTERDLGNLHADIGFQVVATAERVIFQIGPRGVSAS
jgi:phage tail sheath protein FI